MISKHPRTGKLFVLCMNCKLLTLLLCYSLFSCQASLIERKVISEPMQDGEMRVREVNCALHILAALEQSYLQFPLGYKVLCKMYDQYTNIRSNNLLSFITDDSVITNLLLQSLKSTCQWVKLNSKMLSTCSLTGIGQTCAAYWYNYKHHNQTMNLIMEFNEHVKGRATPPFPGVSKFIESKSAIDHFCSKTAVSSVCTCPDV